MTAREFIEVKLGILIEKFPKIRVRYEFHEPSEAHYIEIVPNEIHSLDEDYILWESETWDEFVALFPFEGICFISDDAMVGVENAELTLYGVDYMPTSPMKENIVPEKILKRNHRTNIPLKA